MNGFYVLNYVDNSLFLAHYSDVEMARLIQFKITVLFCLSQWTLAVVLSLSRFSMPITRLGKIEKGDDG